MWLAASFAAKRGRCHAIQVPLRADYAVKLATASRMTPMTRCGAVANGVWSTFSERMRAPMR